MILAPAFLRGADRAPILARLQASSSPSRHVEKISDGQALYFTYVARPLVMGDIGVVGEPGPDTPLYDAHSRPIVLTFGFVVVGSDPAEILQEDLAAAWSQSLAAYRDFLRDESSFVGGTSQPFELAGASRADPIVESLSPGLKPTVLPPKAILLLAMACLSVILGVALTAGILRSSVSNVVSLEPNSLSFRDNLLIRDDASALEGEQESMEATLEKVDDCLLLRVASDRYLTTWPRGTSWAVNGPSIDIAGELVEIGESVEVVVLLSSDVDQLRVSQPEAMDAGGRCLETALDGVAHIVQLHDEE